MPLYRIQSEHPSIPYTEYTAALTNSLVTKGGKVVVTTNTNAAMSSALAVNYQLKKVYFSNIVIGPILWGHSGPLSRVVAVVVVVDIDARVRQW